MATYTKVSNLIPSPERSALITDVAAGDVIDCIDILGRPARGVIITTTDSTDSVTYGLNAKKTFLRKREGAAGFISAWMKTDVSALDPSTQSYTATGLQIQTVDGLQISTIGFFSLTLSVGTTVTVTVW